MPESPPPNIVRFRPRVIAGGLARRTRVISLQVK